MELRGWLVMKMGAGKYVSGWPDCYAAHIKWGQRWFETKVPGGKLRASQIKRFAKLAQYGVEIWVLEGPETYMRLFKNPNWRQYI